MDTSRIASSAAVVSTTSNTPKAPDSSAGDNSNSGVGNYQPPSLPPLPPGQGVRVDQLA
ncbi:hypothetical protein [Bradyrhizobium sp. ARR65]|uniref:hypothetical protein n=1 Tax=Bradyrhizobium sp. ARR65 TaxID=1040989 RepID=UPI000AF0DB09|nr:hypothetical protein [Bradyrhizobium sp. ARR65]